MSVAPETAHTPRSSRWRTCVAITRQRAFGYGVTLILIGLLEVLWFGGAQVVAPDDDRTRLQQLDGDAADRRVA